MMCCACAALEPNSVVTSTVVVVSSMMLCDIFLFHSRNIECTHVACFVCCERILNKQGDDDNVLKLWHLLELVKSQVTAHIHNVQ